jgi:hypothetical protein
MITCTLAMQNANFAKMISFQLNHFHIKNNFGTAKEFHIDYEHSKVHG